MKFIRRVLVIISKVFGRRSNLDIYVKGFDSCAETYDIVETRKLLGKFTEDMLNELNLKPGMHCLDLGCGTGHATEIIERFVRPDGSVIGCDVSEPMLEIARGKLSNSVITKFVKQDMLSFLQGQKDNSADLITSFWAIGYTEPASVLKEIERVLSKGGRAAIIVNIQESLSELQKIATKVIFRNPFMLKCIPPINFPSGIETFRKMSGKAGLKVDTLLKDSCVQAFDSGASLISWMKRAGPCAGFREALKEKYHDYVFSNIENIVDQNGGIKLTFRFIRYIGTKQ